VAGELERAGRIDAGQTDTLLNVFEISPEWMRTTIDRIPEFVARPTLPRGYMAEEEVWLARVEEDLNAAEGAETILAELTESPQLF